MRMVCNEFTRGNPEARTARTICTGRFFLLIHACSTLHAACHLWAAARNKPCMPACRTTQRQRRQKCTPFQRHAGAQSFWMMTALARPAPAMVAESSVSFAEGYAVIRANAAGVSGRAARMKRRMSPTVCVMLKRATCARMHACMQCVSFRLKGYHMMHIGAIAVVGVTEACLRTCRLLLTLQEHPSTPWACMCATHLKHCIFRGCAP